MNMKLVCLMVIIGMVLFVNAEFQGTQHALVSKKLLSTLEAAAQSAGNNLGDACGGAMGDEGCAIASSCSCNSGLVCDTSAGTCASGMGITLCTGECRAPVWVWILVAVVIVAIICCCVALFRRRRSQQAVIMINGPAAQQQGAYIPPQQAYATPVGQQYGQPQYGQPQQQYGQPQYAPQGMAHGQQTTNYHRVPGQN